MNKLSKKLIALALSLVAVSGSVASAASFPDMPTDWTATAMENAVKNKLLNGYDDGTIKPNNNIKRAEMAAIITRSFNALTKADISKFTDVTKDKWYYDEFSKAVAMGAFNGDELSHLNPQKNITFEESFKVIASIFGLIADTQGYGNDFDSQDLSSLDKFADGKDVADWAKPYVAAIVSRGYWNGIDNHLYPKQYITRAQFAVLMDNIIKTYIDEPGEHKTLPAGGVMIRSDKVTIDVEKHDGLILVAESVAGKEPITIGVKELSAPLVVRGGADQVTFIGSVQKAAILRAGIEVWFVNSYAGENPNFFAIDGSRFRPRVNLIPADN